MTRKLIPYHPDYERHAQDAAERLILADWRNGVATSITAARLGMARSTISVRRSEIRRRYQAAATFPTPEERARRVIDMDQVVRNQLTKRRA